MHDFLTTRSFVSGTRLASDAPPLPPLKAKNLPGIAILIACVAAASSGMCGIAKGQEAHRPPAVPLVVNDPYFSIWSMADRLTDRPTEHWSQVAQPMTGLVRIDGTVLRWMGTGRGRHAEQPIPAMDQSSVEVTPLHTRYKFAGKGVALDVTFFTPLFPMVLEVMSRPVTYLRW